MSPVKGEESLNALRARYVFHVLAVAFVAFGIAPTEIRLLLKLAVLIVVWWFSLGVFAIHPAFGFFPHEKRFIEEFGASHAISPVSRWFKAILYGVYWPIFIPKTVYFWSSAAIFLLYTIVKLFFNAS